MENEITSASRIPINKLHLDQICHRSLTNLLSAPELAFREAAMSHRPRAKAIRPGSNLVFVVTTLLLLLIYFDGCSSRITQWGGKIEEANGVLFVQNPSVPISQNVGLMLSEELSIGREDAGDAYLFSDISGLDVDERGRIYVLSRPDAHVRVFDGSGRFLRTIGRKGQGPGEMEMPVFVQAAPDGSLFVFDYLGNRGLFFNSDAVFLRQQASLGTFLPIRMNSKGQIIGIEVLAPPPMGGKIIRAYNSDLKPLFEIAKEESGAERTFDIGKPGVYCAVKSDDSIIWGDSKEYVFMILNPDGKLARKIIKPYDPVPISGEDRESLKQRYANAMKYGMKVEFRSHWPAYSGIFADDSGKIFIKTYEHPKSDKSSFYYDVFDQLGRYYAKVPIGVNLDSFSVWKNGKLYTQEKDPEGIPRIKRYKVTWENKIR